MKLLSEVLKKAREENCLLLREVSALTGIDQSIISKFEKAERKPSRQQILKLAKVYNLNEIDLLISWQSEKVAYEILYEDDVHAILEDAENKIKYLKSMLK
ncbi:helix-turn-helix transcriptional regulator [Bacteroidota bacterium]